LATEKKALMATNVGDSSGF